MQFHEDVVAEVVIQILSVTLLTETVIFTVDASETVASDGFLTTILAIEAFMSFAATMSFIYSLYFEIELRKHWLRVFLVMVMMRL